MRSEKSNELQIRLCTVSRLMEEGWDRKNIRIEIPMSTASSGGRCDIVCLADTYAGCIELKSGSDKLESEALRVQMDQYRRAFDFCGVIADDELYKGVMRITRNSMGSDDNFRHVDVAYHFSWYHSNGSFHTEARSYPRFDKKAEAPPVVKSLTAKLFPQTRWGRSTVTSVIDMASVLWADELREIFGTGSKETKSTLEQRARETMSVSQFRPLYIKALRERPLNEWEIKFWKAFDAGKEPQGAGVMMPGVGRVTSWKEYKADPNCQKCKGTGFWSVGGSHGGAGGSCDCGEMVETIKQAGA